MSTVPANKFPKILVKAFVSSLRGTIRPSDVPDYVRFEPGARISYAKLLRRAA